MTLLTPSATPGPAPRLTAMATIVTAVAFSAALAFTLVVVLFLAAAGLHVRTELSALGPMLATMAANMVFDLPPLVALYFLGSCFIRRRHSGLRAALFVPVLLAAAYVIALNTPGLVDGLYPVASQVDPRK